MRPRGITSVVASLITLLVLGAVLLFLWRVFVYYRQIKSGDLSSLPQFTTQATFLADRVRNSAKPGAVAAAATADDPASGPADAKLTIVEFVDYQCPFCREASSVVRALAAQYGNRVRFQLRDFPVLELHPQAIAAAEAAGCAEAQGKFWNMHDRLFALSSLEAAALDTAAEQSGLDLAAFRSCMRSRERLPEIRADLQDGEGLGVRGTPTFFFNGRRIEGVIPRAVLEELINSFLKG